MPTEATISKWDLNKFIRDAQMTVVSKYAPAGSPEMVVVTVEALRRLWEKHASD